MFVLRDGETFVVERARDHKGKPSAIIDGVEMKTGEADAWIKEKLSWTIDEYDSAAYFTQGDIHKFMESDPAKKRALLMSWMRLGRWDEYRDHASQEASERAQLVERYQTALESLNDPGTSIEELQGKLAVAAQKLAKSRRIKKRKREKVDTLRAELEEAQEQRAQWLDQQEALEREAQSAELEGLMVCGADEWGRR